MKKQSLLTALLIVAAAVGVSHAGKHGFVRAVETAPNGDFKFEMSGTGTGNTTANPVPAAGEAYQVRGSAGWTESSRSRAISQILTAISSGLEVNFNNVASGSDVTWIELLNYRKF